MAEDTHPLQESMERSAKLSELFLPSPPRTLSYLIVLASSVAAAAVLGADIDAVVTASLLVLLPSIASGLLGPGVAGIFRAHFYHRRSAGLAAIGALTTAIGVLGAVLLAPLGVDGTKVLYLAVGLLWVARYGAAMLVVEHRPGLTLLVSAMHPVLALPGLVLSEGTGDLLVGLALWAVLLLPFVLVLRIFDAPLMRNFGISSSELFRSYLDHLTTRSNRAEELLARLGEPVEARVSVIAFRRPDGSRKACICVPCVHPGPFGALGGGDLPAKMRDALGPWEHVLVPHAAANHDLNPVTSSEVERLGHYAAELAEGIEFAAGGSRFREVGETVRMGGQFFGPDLLLTYTSWPEAIDDVDYGVGRGAELVGEGAGARHAVFVDCHNSLRASAGAVFPLTPRAIEIEKLAGEAARALAQERVGALAVGCAQDRSLGITHLVGRAGCQALVVDADGQRTGYVLWDGNNMVPEATKAIRQAVLQVVDEVRVLTTDNHAVNLEGGVYSPVGLRASHERLAEISRSTVEQALADLEPVEAGAAVGHAPGIKVVGHQKTAQLSASVNTMVSIAPELALLCLGTWALGVAAVWLAF